MLRTLLTVLAWIVGIVVTVFAAICCYNKWKGNKEAEAAKALTPNNHKQGTWKICPSCKIKNDINNTFCSYCGGEIKYN